MTVERERFSRENLPAQIRQNDLAVSTAQLLLKVAPWLNLFLVGLAIVALGGVAWVLVSSQREATARSGWEAWLAAVADQGSDGLTEVVDRYPDTPAALWSRMLLAERAIGEGCQQLFADRTRGRERLRAAAELYTEILAGRPAGLAAPQAVFGLAKAREALGELDSARQGYESLVREYPDSPLRIVSERRIAALARGSTRDWYDWFGSLELPADEKPADAGPGEEKPVDPKPAEPEPTDGGTAAAPAAPPG